MRELFLAIRMMFEECNFFITRVEFVLEELDLMGMIGVFWIKGLDFFLD